MCICGGGSIAHTLCAILGSQSSLEVRLLTRRPGEWSEHIKIIYRESSVLFGRLTKISSEPKDVIPGASIVIIAAPAYAYSDIYFKIKPHLEKNMWLGAIPGTGGFEWLSSDAVDIGCTIFGLQRSPYNCIVRKYGSEVDVVGVRGKSYVGTRPAHKAKAVANKLKKLLQLPVYPLPNYLNVTIAPSNTLLHPSRIYSLLHDWEEGKTLSSQIFFYRTWDNLASKTFIKLDEEIQTICRALPLDLKGVTSIKLHYQINTVAELTKVIRNIKSLEKFKAPLKKAKRGWEPDFGHRIYCEDFEVNLPAVKAIAYIAGTDTPTIDTLLKWGKETLKTDQLLADYGTSFPGHLPGYAGVFNQKSLIDFYTM